MLHKTPNTKTKDISILKRKKCTTKMYFLQIYILYISIYCYVKPIQDLYKRSTNYPSEQSLLS